MVMKRYGLRSYEELLTTWNRAQLLVAVDAMFWNSAKEAKDYGRTPLELDPGRLTARQMAEALGLV